MRSSYIGLFIRYTLWVQLLSLPQWTAGLSCFNCNSKTDHGCSNSELKGGHSDKRYSKKCEGNQAVCVKIAVSINGYYEAHFIGKDLKKYYESVDKVAACLGQLDGPDKSITSTPGSKEATTSLVGQPADVAAGASAGASGATGAAAAGSTPAAAGRQGGEHGSHKHDPASHDVSAHAHDHDIPGHQNATTGGTKRCPSPLPFPPRVSVVERHHSRVLYSCGNHSDWATYGVLDRCRVIKDSVVAKTVCTCSSDLCNGAARDAALPLAYVLLAAALHRLRGTIG